MPAQQTEPASQGHQLARFLLEHEACDAGFEVLRNGPDAAGGLAIVCKGCGSRFSYATLMVEAGPEVAVADALVPRQQGASAAAKPPGRRARGQSRETRREPSRPPRSQPSGGRPSLLTAALILLAIGGVTLAIVRLGSRGSGKRAGPSKAAQANDVSSVADTGALNRAGRASRGATGGVTTLRTQSYSLTLPPGWRQATRAGGLSLTPPGRAPVEVRIYFQRQPGLDLAAMVSQSASFLAAAHPGTGISPASPLRTGSADGAELRASYPGGSERALVVLKGPFRYLVISDLGDSAKAALRRQASLVQRSFRPD